MRTTKEHLLVLVCFWFLQLSAQQNTYRIGMLLDSKNEQTVPLIEQLKTEIKATVGEDATIVFSENITLVNNYSIDIAKKQYAQLLANDTDILLVLGVIASEVVREQKNYTKPTILLGAVNTDMYRIDFDKKTSGIENFTYLVEQDSYKDDLETLQKITDFKKVGVLIEQAFIDVLPIEETFKNISKSLDIDCKVILLDKRTNYAKMLTDVDALYIAGGFFLPKTEIKSIAQICIDKKLPSFTINNRTQVEAGIMATRSTSNNFNQIIRRLALTVERYVNGGQLSKMQVHVASKKQLVINYNTTDAIGVGIKYSMVNEAEFVGAFTNANPVTTYSLKQAIDKAIGKNLDLQAAKKNIELQAQEVTTAKNNYLPLVTANGEANYTDPDIAALGFGQTPEFQTSGNISLDQTIFSEAANANKTIQKQLQEAEQEQYKAENLNTIFNVAAAYFEILIRKTNAEILRSNLQTTKKNYIIAQQNFEAGISGKSDMLRFKSEIAQNTQLLVEAFNQLEQGYIGLNQLLNNPVNTKIDVENVPLELGLLETVQYTELNALIDNPVTRGPFIAFLTEEAKKNAPELKVLGHNLEATKRSVKLNSSGRFLPTIGLQAQYNTVFSRDGKGSTTLDGFILPDNTYNVGVRMTIPLFNRNQTRTNQQTAIIQREQLNLTIENSELAISSNVNNGILNVINQMTNIDLSKVSENTAKEALELIQVSYAEGAVNIVQLIDAQRNYLNAQINRTTAIYSYLLSILQVERSIGYFFLMNSTESNAAFISRFLDYQKK
ncbi:TolC family protein [Flavivirga amylovorans]|uniref:TolC family protein n=1 Tax=Flavivirga amylovorans TaxID=870486 RepID=A0ABT8X0X8_9FLAO|nr:TolC family protein [Flavivirga amylovorans]MDO5987598.1 TolC family protein [Flavivirga amylovorans]